MLRTGEGEESKASGAEPADAGNVSNEDSITEITDLGLRLNVSKKAVPRLHGLGLHTATIISQLLYR